ADGRLGTALHRSTGRRRPDRGRARPVPDRRAQPALRQDRDAVRRRRPRRARRLRRNPGPGPRRPVRRHHEGNLLMNAAAETLPVAKTPAHRTHRFALLLRRESWEHRGGFFWAPVIAGAVSLLLTAIFLV